MVQPEFSDLEKDFAKIAKISSDQYIKLIDGTESSLNEAEVECPRIGAHAAVMSLVVGLIVPNIYGGVRNNESPEAAEKWLVATLEDIRTALEKNDVIFEYRLGVKK